MAAQGEDRRYGVLGKSPATRSWGAAHPAGMAAMQGLVFGVLFGLFIALVSGHHSVGWDVVAGAVLALVFGLAMWVVNTVRGRQNNHA